MRQIGLIKQFFLGATFLLSALTAYAASPVWTFQPLTDTKFTLTNSQTATVNYSVTNQSNKTHTLVATKVKGIDVSGCTAPLAGHQTCTLSLQINGSQLAGSVIGGPELCALGNPMQCYHPSQANQLEITLTTQPPSTFSVTPSGDGNELFTPSTPQTVNSGSTQQFNVTANTGYTLGPVGGTCPAGSFSGSTYTTGAITSDCTVQFTATINQYTLTPVAGANGSISPSTPVTVNYNGSSTFTATPNANYYVSQWKVDGNVVQTGGASYLISNVTANHTVEVDFLPNPVVSPSGDGNETFTPNTAGPVTYGQTKVFTNVAPNTGYALNPVGGTCPAGSLVGTTYTTGAITSDCTVLFSASIIKYTVNASAGANGSIAPSGAVLVNYNGNQTFTATPNANYSVNQWILDGTPVQSGGLSYTINNVTANHTLQVTFVINPQVTPSGQNLTYSPNGPQYVVSGQTASYTVTPNSGYNLAANVDGTCPQGSYSGNVWTTGAITADCTVIFNVTPQNVTVTPLGDGNVVITPSTAQTIPYGSTQQFNVTANSGYLLSQTVQGTCPLGSFTGSVYTTSSIVSDCTVSFSAVPYFPAAAAPSNIIAVPGDGMVKISWTAPTNIGGGALAGYIVTYGVSGGSTYSINGCRVASANPPTTCTVTGLANGTSFTFFVRSGTTLDGANILGPGGYSNPATPESGLVAFPATLAMSGLGTGGQSRTITITNTTGSPITVDAAPTTGAFSPALPAGTTVSGTTCNTGTVLAANGGNCTVTFTPGSTVSQDGLSHACTSGYAPIPSDFILTGNSAAYSITVSAVVVGYGCDYQGGFIYAIDDSTASTSSIGGMVTSIKNQASPGTYWSTNNVGVPQADSIWGIASNSTTTTPVPDQNTPSAPAALQAGQLNCNGNTDGACNSDNVLNFYSGIPSNFYAAGLCSQRWDDTGASCTMGTNCYPDWYLPSVCEFGKGATYCTGVTQGGMWDNLPSALFSCPTPIGTCIHLGYWSSTENTGAPDIEVLTATFTSSVFSQNVQMKNVTANTQVRCSRKLTS